MILIVIFFTLVGGVVGFLAGKFLLTPLLLPVAHLVDKAAGYEISGFFRRLFVSANEPEFILDGDPLKLPVMILSIAISIWIGIAVFGGIGEAAAESEAGEDEKKTNG